MLRKKYLSLLLTVFTVGAIVSCGTGNSSSEQPSSPNNSSSEPVSSEPVSSEKESSSEVSSSEEATTYTVTFYDDGRVYGEPSVVKEGEKVTAPTVPTREGDEFVDYTFKGWYEAGQKVAYDFEKPVTKELSLYSSFEEVAKTYDLVVFVYGINGASEPTTYITEEESNYMRDAFKATLSEEKNILWHYSTGKTNKNFNKFVIDSVVPVDVVISGNKLNNDEYSIECHETYGKVHMGEGWIENTSRYLTITSACSSEHLELARGVYSLISSMGPKYQVTLDSEAATVQVGETKQLTATYYGTGVTWTSSAEAVATVSETGLVTAVAAGTATITVKDAANNTATCEITVTEAPIVPKHDLVIVLNNSNASNNWMSVEAAENLIAAFQREGQPGHGKDIVLHVVSGVNIAGVVEAIEGYNADDLARVDVALCRSAFFTNKACPAMLEGGTIVDVDGTWGYSGGQVGIFANAFESHLDLARAFQAFVDAQHIDYFEMDESCSVDLGSTKQLTVVEGATYVSGNEAIATVSETGLVTSVAPGSTKITVSKGLYSVEVPVTVTAAVSEPVTINVYVHLTASKTTYMTEENLTALKAHVESTISSNITINWTELTKVNNAGVAEAISESEETVHLVICGKGVFDTVQDHESAAYAEINSTYSAEGEKRYVAPLAGISNAELAACLEVYNALKA